MKVINIMNHGPAYEILNEQKRPLWKWEQEDGSEICIVNREWPGLMGHWILQKKTIEWEVWQPDFKASRIYTHQFPDGVVHRLIPAIKKMYRFGGLRPIVECYSDVMLNLLNQISEKTIVILYRFEFPFWYSILDKIQNNNQIRCIIIDLGTITTPLQRFFHSRHPLSFPACIIEQIRMRIKYARFHGIYGCNTASISSIKKVYKGSVGILNVGCDFHFFTPVPSVKEKHSIRAELSISKSHTVFLTVALLRPVKQIHKLIRAFSYLRQREDWMLFIVGAGEPNYEQYLKQLVHSYGLDHQIRFFGYLEGENLRRLYWASDVYICSSSSEGAPAAVMEAIACGLPVLSTPVGGVYEVMRAHQAGRILDLKDKKEWISVFRDVLDLGLPKPLDRKIAENYFDWRAVADRVLVILQKIWQGNDEK